MVSGQPRPQGAFPKPGKSALRTRLVSGEASANLMGGIKGQNTGLLSVVLVEEKFQSLTVNPRNIDAENDDKTLNIDNHDVRKAEQIKLLGVFIDEKLNFAGHITELCTRANQKVGMLLRLRNLIPCNANLMLYKTSILPYLTYCHLVWKFYKSSDSRKIERIQERALRAVYKSQSETYEELLTSAKLPRLMIRVCKTLQY